MSGDELCPAVDDVEVTLLATLGHGGQQLLVLLVDDPHTYLRKEDNFHKEKTLGAVKLRLKLIS